MTGRITTARAERIRHEPAEAFRRMHEWNVREYSGRAPGSPRHRAPRVPIGPIEMAPGERVKFYGDRRWWDVRAVGRRHVVLTRTRDFGRGGLLYTVIAWAEGRRGPHGSWGHGAETDEQIAETLAALEAGEIDMSERHSIRLDLEAVRAAREAVLRG